MRNPKYAALTGAMLLGLLSFSFSASAALPAELNGKEVPSLAPLVDKTAPAVVNIRTRATVSAPMNPLMEDPFFRRFFGVPEGGERQREVSSAGSGVIVDAAKGHILTNHHVVTNNKTVTIIRIDKDCFMIPPNNFNNDTLFTYSNKSFVGMIVKLLVALGNNKFEKL